MKSIKHLYETVAKPYVGGAFFSVEERLTRHMGRNFIRHVVRHPGGVGVVALVDGYAVCVEQYRPAVRQVLLEIPAGKAEENESPQETGERELLEETGFRATWMSPLTRFYNAPCFCDGMTEVFVAGVTPAGAQQQPIGDFPTQVRMVDLNQVEELIHSEELIDAKSIISLLLARNLLARTPEIMNR